MKINMAVEKLLEINRFGLDCDHYEKSTDKVSEELQEVKEAILEGNQEHLKEELGDLILASINLSRYLGFDPEETLTISFEKLSSRFECFKKIIEEKKLDIKRISVEARSAIWEESKNAISNGGDRAR